MRNLLTTRAELIDKIRQYFNTQGVVEVATTTLSEYPITDSYIDSLSLQVNAGINQTQTLYLHTSPELEMKKLIACGSGDIYQISQVYRDNEYGAHHFNEFTILEYYRLGFDIHALMDDIITLLKTIGMRHTVERVSYQDIFLEYAGFDILDTDFTKLQAIAKNHGLSSDFNYLEDLQTLLFVHFVEPKLHRKKACFIYDYPFAQAALAKTRGRVAKRFELYLGGVEVANGYDELQTAKDYKARFLAQIDKRRVINKCVPKLNEDFINTLKTPLPQCSGVAIGMDRLLAQIDTLVQNDNSGTKTRVNKL